MLAVRNILSLVLAVVVSLSATAQNYQCVQDSVINYFTNKGHYLRAIRVDSVRTVNGNKVLYPFKTARGDYFNKKLHMGGSWLGETITVLPDGTHWFQNYSGDTLVVKTQATLNDSWVLYDDTGSVWYEAVISAVDTMTVLGTLDSIKIVTITAKDSGGVVISDIYNGRTLILSKDHGFVRSFDLYNFPSQLPHGFDYYSYKAGSLDFNLVSFHNPTMLELHDYQPGDRFQRMDYSFMYVYVAYTSLLILEKQITAPNQITYKVLNTAEKVRATPPLGNETVMKIETILADTTKLFNMQKLPEEWGEMEFLFYSDMDTQFCYMDKYYSAGSNFVNYIGDSASVNTFEPCGTSVSYKLGSGMVKFSQCNDPTGFNPYWYLKHVNKNNNPCGSYHTLSIDEIDSGQSKVKIYPNPAYEYIWIEAVSAPNKIAFIDVTGRMVHSENITAARHKIDTRHFPPGTYLLQLTDDKGNRMTQKIMVQH